MPTQKTFKRRVRARMVKTGESYTAARHQLLRRAAEPPQDAAVAAAQPPDAVAARPSTPDGAMVSDDAMARASGRTHAEWFALLDDWGATARTHTEIARWLREAHGVPGWWDQSLTVAYERARGMRRQHEMLDGFRVTATKTIAADAADLLAAFTTDEVRARWLPGVELRRRPTTADLTRRFDWTDPPSRVVVTAVPKSDGRTTIAVSHERLPDGAAAEREKAHWRERLAALKSLVEAA